MFLVVSCPSCGRRLRMLDEYLDQTVQCPACQTQFRPGRPAVDAPPSDELEPASAQAPAEPEGTEVEPPAEEHVATSESAHHRRAPLLAAPRARHRPVKKRRNVFATLAVLGSVFGLIGLYVAIVLWQLGRPLDKGVAVPPVGEDPEQRRQEILDAFQKQKPLDEKEIAAEIRPLFAGLSEAARAHDEARVLSHFNLDRLFDEVIDSGLLPPEMRRERQGFIRGARQGLGKSLARQDAVLTLDDLEIRNIRKMAGNEAGVITRSRGPAGTFAKIRWWVTKRTGAWQVYDLEDLDTGIRVSTTVGALAGMGVNNPQIRLVPQIVEALQAVALRQDADAAEQKLKAVQNVPLPNQLEALRLLVVALVHFQRNQFPEALATLEKAHACRQDMPIVDSLKGIAFNRLGKWGQALSHLEKYRDLLGDDAALCRELGESLRGLNQFPEARVAYRKSLDYDAKDIDAFLGLIRAIGPGDNADDVGPRFLKLGATPEQFDECAEDCRQGNDGPMMGRLATAMRQVHPDHAPAAFYLALSKSWAGQAGEALPLFRAALDKLKDAGKRSQYLAEYVRAASVAGKISDAYATLPDAREAFRALAAELTRSARTEDLRRLLTAHAEKVPNDPLLPFYRGELYAHQGKYDLAEKAFAEGMAKKQDGINPDDFRASRVLARYHTGQALSAYADIGPRHETFLQLVNIGFVDENYPLVEAVLDAHAKNFPDNGEVMRQRCRLALRRDRVEEGVKWFRAALARHTQSEERKRLVHDFLYDCVDAGKPLEAYKTAPDAREAFRVLADDLVGMNRNDLLRALLEAHKKAHASDVWIPFFEGECHLQARDWDKAVGPLAEAWKKGPADLIGRARSSYTLALYKTGKGVEAHQELGFRKETFQQLANLMANDKKGKDLEALVAAHRPHAGEDAELLFAEARAKVLQGRIAEAGPLLQAACQKQPLEAQRRYYVTQVVAEAEAAGRGLEAYRAAPDKVAAFQTLARTLADRKQADRLDELLKEHGKTQAADPWVSQYAGELLLLRGQAKEAAKHYTAALAKGSSPDQWALRQGLTRARVLAGEAVKLYQECGTGAQAFTDLAFQCQANKDAGQLEVLLAAHRKTDPDDPNLASWELEVRWLKNDYKEVLALLEEHRDGIFRMPSHRWKVDNYRVRCLVKLKRTDEALREAEAITKTKQGNRVLLVLAHAARGDVPKVLATIGQQRPGSFLLEDCYRDADLGPILRSEPFREFRERFPEPTRVGPVDDVRDD
jgi:predicted Zn-dependent protease